MQQMYELWLQLTNQSRRSDPSSVTPPLEDKQVTISADYTESLVNACEMLTALSRRNLWTTSAGRTSRAVITLLPILANVNKYQPTDFY